MSQPINSVQALLRQKGASAFFITNPKNIYYCTQFIGISLTERESSLLVTPNASYLFVPAMYQERAEQAVQQKNSTPCTIIVDHERYGILTSFSQFVHENEVVLVEANNLTLTEFEKIQNATKAKLRPEKFLIEQLRTVKTSQEISFLQKACEITDHTFNAIVNVLGSTDYTKMTELDIADFMRVTSRELGAHGFGFDPIIACGAGAAEPHYFTSHKKLQPNNCLLMDFGFTFNGYTADLTRTLFLGTAPTQFKNMYSLVQQCNKKCIDACQRGVPTHELYSLSHTFFQKHGVEKNYLHSLGHGVGLDVHESPSLGQGQEHILDENMVVTIEPGLYFTGQFGIRIEDVLVVTPDEPKVLSYQSSKELIEIT